MHPSDFESNIEHWTAISNVKMAYIFHMHTGAVQCTLPFQYYIINDDYAEGNQFSPSYQLPEHMHHNIIPHIMIPPCASRHVTSNSVETIIVVRLPLFAIV